MELPIVSAAEVENTHIAVWCAGFETARNDIAMILARNTSELAKLAQVRAWLEDS